MHHPTVRPPRLGPGRPRPLGGRAASIFLGLALAVIGSVGPSMADDPPGRRVDGAARARVASAPPDAGASRKVLDAAPVGRGAPHAGSAESEHIARARQIIDECLARYRATTDYTCTFFKRERVDGALYDMHVMQMKARTRPSSLYFKFVQPNAGREAIYVQGRHGNKILAHDVGIGRVVAGTMKLDPKGGMAMEENRHPVTEAGIGSLIETVRDRWALDLNSENSRFTFHPQAKVGDRPCVLIETTHPKPGPQFLFYNVKLYVDKELNLPIRFEAYDWPSKPGLAPLLMEEYTYMNLRLNVGLTDRDFDAGNAQYSFGRF